MKLHRTSGRPDWQDSSPQAWNAFQRLAAATRGVISPGNFITFVGLIVVVVGLIAVLRTHFVWGLIALVVGRLLDVVDGLVAEATKTKSPLGEIIDATVDKIATFGTIIVSYVATVARPWVLIVLVAPHLITSIISLYARAKGRTVHPSKLGKISMAGLWVCLTGFIVARALGLGLYSPLDIVLSIAAIISSLSGLIAAYGYLKNSD